MLCGSATFVPMNYHDQKQHPTSFLALTSLTLPEFEYLLQEFTPLWNKYYKYHTLEGKKRILPPFAEHGNALLKGPDQKLFFLLVYMKNNPPLRRSDSNLSSSHFRGLPSQSIQDLSYPAGRT